MMREKGRPPLFGRFLRGLETPPPLRRQDQEEDRQAALAKEKEGGEKLRKKKKKKAWAEKTALLVEQNPPRFRDKTLVGVIKAIQRRQKK